MSWIQTLYETYERCANAPQFDKQPLNPVSSAYQDTQIEVTISGEGDFRRAELRELTNTVIPVSEESASRSGTAPAPNPLSDKLEYCAGDIRRYGETHGRFAGYHTNLRNWCTSDFADPKARCVLEYVERCTLVEDLLRANVLACEGGKLRRLKINEKKTIDAKDAWVRWRVEIPGVLAANTWEDLELFRRWAGFEGLSKASRGLCMVAGSAVRLARVHPRGIRTNSDRAKLISSNDTQGFTFRGRFVSAEQAAGVGYDISQKAHNALRWLIKRQGSRAGAGQVYVAWETLGNDVPDPQASTAEWLGLSGGPASDLYSGDAGQLVALRLRSKIQGYRAVLGDTSTIGVIGIDTAAEDTGRLAITYYRELTGSDFLRRIEEWHTEAAWLQPVSESPGGRSAAHRYMWYAGAPSPNAIASAAFGSRVQGDSGKRLLFATIERLLPCIVDGRPIPRDIVAACAHRAVRRPAFQKSEGGELGWEKCVGVACALIRRNQKKEQNYQMALEENRVTRDYLFGRLLAIAENIEQRALHLAGDTRGTNAGRLMQRFADHPCSTWRSIENNLVPYRVRLRTSRPSALLRRDKLLDRVMDLFTPEDFISPNKLSGEFLLGYHCQRTALWKDKPNKNSETSDEKINRGETL
jgi:CRISPR-associated protein Csd1